MRLTPLDHLGLLLFEFGSDTSIVAVACEELDDVAAQWLLESFGPTIDCCLATLDVVQRQQALKIRYEAR